MSGESPLGAPRKFPERLPLGRGAAGLSQGRASPGSQPLSPSGAMLCACCPPLPPPRPTAACPRLSVPFPPPLHSALGPPFLLPGLPRVSLAPRWQQAPGEAQPSPAAGFPSAGLRAAAAGRAAGQGGRRSLRALKRQRPPPACLGEDGRAKLQQQKQRQQRYQQQ